MKKHLRKFARALVLSGAAFAGGAAADFALGKHASATPGVESPYASVQQLGRVIVAIENAYVEPVDRKKMVDGAIEGMVAGLDPHSSYMPKEAFALFESDTQGQFGGVGVEVDARNDAVTVLAPIEGSPAQRAGVKRGDKIVAIDGDTALGVGLEKMVRKMRGAPGTHVKLTVERGGSPEPITFDLVREIIHVPSVASKRLAKGIAYVRVKQFQEHTHEELLRAVARLRGEGAITGLVLDLRNDPGGLVDESAEVADEMLTGGTIYSARHRGHVIDEVSAHSGGALVDMPEVVLVNEWTASAAELVAGALQDHGRAKIVGVNTFGKGSVQTIYELPDGAGMRLTTERYYTPNGHAIQADGVHPDVVVETPTDNPLPSMRERDIEGHLAGESSRAGTATAQVVIDAGAPHDSGAPPPRELDGVIASDVDTDPEKGSDPVLKVGYAMVLRALGNK